MLTPRPTSPTSPIRARRPSSSNGHVELSSPTRRPLRFDVEDPHDRPPSSTPLGARFLSLLPSLKLGTPPPSAHDPLSARHSPFPDLLQRRADQGNAARREAVAGRAPALVWFQHDLRTHDHAGLARAHQAHSSFVPIYIFDASQFPPSSASRARSTGVTQAKLILDSLTDLRAKLRALGSDLLVRRGKPAEILAQIAKKVGASAVYCSHSAVPLNLASVRAAVEATGAALKVVTTATLRAPEDLPFPLAELPATLEDYQRRVSHVAIRAEAEVPRRLRGLPMGAGLEAGAIPTLQDLGFDAQRAADASADTCTARGGETAALRSLDQLLQDLSGGVLRPGPGRLVPAGQLSLRYGALVHYLALGSLSARRVMDRLQRLQGAGEGDARVLRGIMEERDFHQFRAMRGSAAGPSGREAGASAAVGSSASSSVQRALQTAAA